MNIVPDASGALSLRLDLAAIRSLLDSYFETDLWDIAFDPALPGTLEVVIAQRSGSLSPADRARLQAAPPHVHVNFVDADHWLHIEAPLAVVELLASRLA
jgi:hypothetical protein